MTTSPTATTAYQCPDCATIYTEDDLVPIYECSRCGQTSTERRCQDDNIFTARAGSGCESCEVPCAEIEAVEDHDGQLIPVEDWDPDDSKADRDATEATERERALAAEAQQKRDALAAASEQISVSDLTVGDWIIHPTPTHSTEEGTTVEVVAVLEWGGPTLGLVYATYGSTSVIAVHPGHQIMRVPAPEYRRLFGPFGMVTFDEAPDEPPFMSSPSRNEKYTVEVSHLPKRPAPLGGVPCLTVWRSSGGYLTPLGVFVDQQHAMQALDTWEVAARALAAGRGSDITPDPSAVTVEHEKWAGAEGLGRQIALGLGTLDWGQDTTTPYLHADLPGMSITIDSADLLAAAIEAARAHLDHLRH